MNRLTREEHQTLFRTLIHIPQAQEGMFLERSTLQNYQLSPLLYLRWWAFRPTHCASCQQNEKWVPGTDDVLYSCPCCFSDVHAPQQYGTETDFDENNDSAPAHSDYYGASEFADTENVQSIDHAELFEALDNFRLGVLEWHVEHKGSEVAKLDHVSTPGHCTSDLRLPTGYKQEFESTALPIFTLRQGFLAGQVPCSWTQYPDLLRAFCSYASQRGVSPLATVSGGSCAPLLCFFHIIHPFGIMSYAALRRVVQHIELQRKMCTIDDSAPHDSSIGMQSWDVPFSSMDATSPLPSIVHNESTPGAELYPIIALPTHTFEPFSEKDAFPLLKQLATQVALSPCILNIDTPEIALICSSNAKVFLQNPASNLEIAPDDFAACTLLTVLLHVRVSVSEFTPFRETFIFYGAIGRWIEAHMAAIRTNMFNATENCEKYSMRATEPEVPHIFPELYINFALYILAWRLGTTVHRLVFIWKRSGTLPQAYIGDFELRTRALFLHQNCTPHVERSFVNFTPINLLHKLELNKSDWNTFVSLLFDPRLVAHDRAVQDSNVYSLKKVGTENMEYLMERNQKLIQLLTQYDQPCVRTHYRRLRVRGIHTSAIDFLPESVFPHSSARIESPPGGNSRQKHVVLEALYNMPLPHDSLHRKSPVFYRSLGGDKNFLIVWMPHLRQWRILRELDISEPSGIDIGVKFGHYLSDFVVLSTSLGRYSSEQRCPSEMERWDCEVLEIEILPDPVTVISSSWPEVLTPYCRTELSLTRCRIFKFLNSLFETDGASNSLFSQLSQATYPEKLLELVRQYTESEGRSPLDIIRMGIFSDGKNEVLTPLWQSLVREYYNVKAQPSNTIENENQGLSKDAKKLNEGSPTTNSKENLLVDTPPLAVPEKIKDYLRLPRYEYYEKSNNELLEIAMSLDDFLSKKFSSRNLAELQSLRSYYEELVRLSGSSANNSRFAKGGTHVEIGSRHGLISQIRSILDFIHNV